VIVLLCVLIVKHDVCIGICCYCVFLCRFSHLVQGVHQLSLSISNNTIDMNMEVLHSDFRSSSSVISRDISPMLGRRRRLSHRDILLEKSLRESIDLSTRYRKTAHQRHFEMKYGRVNEMNYYSNDYDSYCSDNLNEDSDGLSTASSCDDDSIEGSDCGISPSAIFDNDSRFDEVDGFFVLKAAEPCKRKRIWSNFLLRK